MRKGLSPEAKQTRVEYHINQRLKYSPENIFFVENTDWRYISVHPVADEDWWFEKFNQKPEICVSADFYWQFDGDVAFLEVNTSHINTKFDEELFSARWIGGRKDGLLNLHAKVLDDLVYSSTVIRVMKIFWEYHQKIDLFETYYLKNNLKKLE